jgi:hypothetical protein
MHVGEAAHDEVGFPRAAMPGPEQQPPPARVEAVARSGAPGHEFSNAKSPAGAGRGIYIGRAATNVSRRPRAETPTHWMVMGLNPDLDEGMKIAVRETIDFITGKFPHLTREEAYMIASVAVDYHVTQVVDGTKGVHGMIPKSIFKQ